MLSVIKYHTQPTPLPVGPQTQYKPEFLKESQERIWSQSQIKKF